MSFPSESDKMSKELQNSVNLMTDVVKIIVKYRRKIIAKYRHLSYRLVGTELKGHPKSISSKIADFFH